MNQFDLTNYLNVLKGMRFRTQNEFAKAKYWQKNIIKDLKTPFDVPNIVLGKKYYIDWTRLENRYKGGKADTHYKMMCNCGIGEIIFEKVALYKSTFGGTEISLFGICATSNGIDNFKIILKDKIFGIAEKSAQTKDNPYPFPQITDDNFFVCLDIHK